MQEKARNLKQLVNEKEQEWKALLQNQIDSLLKELADTDENLNLEKIRFQKLKKDFQYNLQLLSERDKELENYEQIFQQLKANDLLLSSQLSEMKIKMDDVNKQKELLQREKEDLQHHYQSVRFKYSLKIWMDNHLGKFPKDPKMFPKHFESIFSITKSS